MVTFWVAVLLLIAGYFVYGRITERIFGIDNARPTPAGRLQDGVDYVPMRDWRVFLVQFLNIAGIGPIFGAIAGACWGPVSYLWIVLGTIFAGGVHDYLSGMMSLRHDGQSVSELVRTYLGRWSYALMLLFSFTLLLLVGVVFVKAPADLLHNLTSGWNVQYIPSNAAFWVILIFIYYIFATLLPVDKIIGRIYPAFGLLLLLMAMGLVVGIILHGHAMPELTLQNLHPSGTPIFPYLFITIACGAISGFHSTQSPIMSRCLMHERAGRRVFYGAMVAEGIVALIWAMAAQAYFGSTTALAGAGSPAVIVHDVSFGVMGIIGGALAVIGVIICPITSGDTAFRSARLIVADCLRLSQKRWWPRLIIAIPMFVLAIAITFVDFTIVWRYFAWANQTLATIVLWTGAAFLARYGRWYWIAVVPGTFMTAVVTAYILQAPEGLGINKETSNICGIIAAAVIFGAFMLLVIRRGRRDRAGG